MVARPGHQHRPRPTTRLGHSQDLLDTNPSHNPAADDQAAPAPEPGARDLDDCQAMVWRITVLTDPPPPVEDLDDDPPHEDELPPIDIDVGVEPSE